MNATCPCPMLPDLSELSAADLAKIVGAPLRCTSCGHELELSCPAGHVHQAPQTASPNPRVPRSDIGQPHNLKRPMAWKPKLCTDCGARFKPTGGRDIRCPGCKDKRG